MRDYRTKMQVFKNDFALQLQNTFSEGQLLHAHKNGLWSLTTEARRISTDPNLNKEEDTPKVEQIFEELWAKVMQELGSGAKLSDIQWTYIENLGKTFRAVNKFMPEISRTTFTNEILKCIESQANTEIPLKLHEYMKMMLSHGFFAEHGGPKSQFKLDVEKLGLMTEDPQIRLFSEHDANLREHYLHLKELLVVDYEF